MRASAVCLTFSVIAAVSSAAPAGAQTSEADRLQLAITSPAQGADSRHSEILVDGSAGRYDRLASSSVKVPLALAAGLKADSDGVTILKSELFLKAEGTGKDARGLDTLEALLPVKAISEQRTMTLAFSPQGPVAQNAIAACNGLAPSERAAGATRKLAMNLPIVWRVTSGRFNFKWTNYDRVAPSADIVNNRDFYAEQEASESETTVDATVVCQPLSGANAVAAAPVAAVKRVTFTPEPAATKAAAKPAARTEVAARSVDIAPVADTGKPLCTGGMIRQLQSSAEGYLCLCPGNTQRVETGTNAYACERGRRR